MNQEFDIRTFRPESVRELAEFLGKEYPSGEISDEKHLSWEYMDNPSGKAIVTTASNPGGLLVSQYALSPMQVYAGDEIIPGSLSLNTLTAEGYRGKGFFALTARDAFSYCAANGIAFTFGIPNRNSFPGFVRRLKFTNAGNLVFMARPLKPLKLIASMAGRKNQKKGSSIGFIIDKKKLNEKGISDLMFPHDEEVYNTFLNAWHEQGFISVHRTPAFLNWRYVQSPLRYYKVLKFVEGGEMKAMAVIRAMHLYGMRVCLVMDHLSLDENYSRLLFQAISGEARNNQLELMIAVAAHKKTSQHAQLIKSEFWSVPGFLLPQQLPFIMKAHIDFENSSRLFALENWHFSFGDYDVF